MSLSSYELVLVGSLLALVIVLAGALLLRIREDRRRTRALRTLQPDTFSDLLSVNSRQGTIAEVASKVSDLMKDSFACDTIVFVRKKRGHMICNFGHGLGDIRRNEFRFPYSKGLFECLRESFLPRELRFLDDHVPEAVREKLNALGTDRFFPVFWRDNLYGIYFIRSSIETSSPAFICMIASLAQCLSAAYHIKWHETRRESYAREVDELSQELKMLRSESGRPPSILNLVAHRNPETLVPKIVEAVKEDIGLSDVEFYYRSNDGQRELKILSKDGRKPASSLAPETFDKLIETLGRSTSKSLDRLRIKADEIREFKEDLKSRGIKNLAPFSISEDYQGILAFSGNRPRLDKWLEHIQNHASTLLTNAESYAKVEEMSLTDDLTGLANKRYLFRRLDEEISRAVRHKRKLALILFDLDELKQINDTHGHQAGDEILSQLGDILRNSTRSIDIVARYGGDEFCVVMPEADYEQAGKFMGRLQRSIASSNFGSSESGQKICCTASLGGAIFPDHAKDREKLIFVADMALLRAKEAGRNLAILAGEEAIQE